MVDILCNDSSIGLIGQTGLHTRYGGANLDSHHPFQIEPPFNIFLN